MRALLLMSSLLPALAGMVPLAFAGGIQLGRTRIIYEANMKEVALPLINNENELPWLIQSRVMNADGTTRAPFIITPPLFRLDPQMEQSLRIMWSGSNAPEDRESLFYVDVRMIPASDKQNEDKNVLRLIYKTRIKLFYRPRTLKGSSEETCKNLAFTRSGNQLHIRNPGDFYSVFGDLRIGGYQIKTADMVAPKNSVTLPVAAGALGQTVIWRCINDYGSTSAQYNAPIHSA